LLTVGGFERLENMEPSPFKVGEMVRYKPSRRGLGLDANTPPEQKLVPNRAYRIEAVQQDNYIVVEGYRHSGGGIHWTEFAKDE